MYNLRIRSSVEKSFHKLAKKNPKQLEIIEKKVNEIKANPHHYKNLRVHYNTLKESTSIKVLF